jgi:hypothetical protein
MSAFPCYEVFCFIGLLGAAPLSGFKHDILGAWPTGANLLLNLIKIQINCILNSWLKPKNANIKAAYAQNFRVMRCAGPGMAAKMADRGAGIAANVHCLP